MAVLFKSTHNFKLMSRGNPRKNAGVLTRGKKRAFGKGIKLRSGSHIRGALRNVQIFCNGKRRFGVVAGNHNRANSGIFTFEHGFRSALSGRIKHSAKAYKRKAFFAYFSAGIILIPKRKYAQSAKGHLRKLLFAICQHFFRKGAPPVFVKIFRAKGQKHIRRALDENKAACF